MASVSTLLASNTPFRDTHKTSFNGFPISRRHQTGQSAKQNGLSISMSASSPPTYDLNQFRFAPIKESIVAREMTRRYMTDMITYADTDVVVVGAGSAGLSCAYELSKNPSVRVCLVYLPLIFNLYT